jgi:hypothetical protein
MARPAFDDHTDRMKSQGDFASPCASPFRITPGDLANMLRQRIEPTPRGVIVVRSRISNGVRDAVVGEMRITRIAIEAELEHSDSRQLELIAKRNHIGSDNAEVFGNERQMAQLRPDASKKAAPGPGTQCPGSAVLAVGGTCQARKTLGSGQAESGPRGRATTSGGQCTSDNPSDAGLPNHIPGCPRVVLWH